MTPIDAFKALIEAAAGINDKADAIAAARALVRAAGAILAPGDKETLACFIARNFNL